MVRVKVDIDPGTCRNVNGSLSSCHVESTVLPVLLVTRCHYQVQSPSLEGDYT
jgi:hypothetical protein